MNVFSVGGRFGETGDNWENENAYLTAPVRARAEVAGEGAGFGDRGEAQGGAPSWRGTNYLQY